MPACKNVDCAAPAGSVIDAAAASCGWVYQADRCLVCHQHPDLREPDAWDHLGESLPVRVTAPLANLGSPSRHPAASRRVGVLALVPHAALAERELMLRVHQRSRCARSHAGSMRRVRSIAIADDVIVLVRGHRMPDFVRQLLADHPSLPHAATPHRHRHDQEEGQEDHELRQCFSDEILEKPDIERRLVRRAAACRRQHPRACRATAARCSTCEPQWPGSAR